MAKMANAAAHFDSCKNKVVGNRSYYALQPLVSNKHVLRKLKEIIYKTVLKPAVMCGSESYTTVSYTHLDVYKRQH